MPRIGEPSLEAQPNKKKLEITGRKTREENTLRILRKDAEARKDKKRGEDLSFKERQKASGRFELARGFEDEIKQAQAGVMKELSEILRKDEGMSLEDAISVAQRKLEIKAIPRAAKEELIARGRKLQNLIKRKEAATGSFTTAPDGSAEEQIHKKIMDKYTAEIEAYVNKEF